jgi:NTP pyrophosphatase (non-canonical NTP hydrolase)
MLVDEYQKAALTTERKNYESENHRLSVLALGLAGESGEVADMIKKAVGHGHTLDKDKLVKELGDVCWYVACMANAVGVSLDIVMQRNKEKLKTRYPDGFSTEASINRVDTKK